MGNVLKAIITADASGLDSGVKQGVSSLDKLEAAFADLKSKGLVNLASIEAAMTDLKKGIKLATDPKEIKAFTQSLAFLADKEKEFKQSAGLDKHFDGVSRGSQKAATSALGLARVFDLFPPEAQHLTHAFDGLLQSFESFESQTGSAAGGLKALGKSLIGPVGIGIAITAGIALLEEFGGKLFETSEGAKALQSSIEDSAKKLSEEAVKLTSITGIVKNNNASNEDRKKALQAINQEYKEYLDNLGIESVNLGNITEAYNKIIDAIVKQAVVKGLQDEITASVEKTAKSLIALGIEEEKRKSKEESAAKKREGQLNTEEKQRKTLTDGLGAFRAQQGYSTDATIRQNQVLEQGAKKLQTYDERVKLLKESLTKELAPLLNLTSSYADLGIKLDKIKDPGDKFIEQAKKIAAFLDKNTQFSVKFEVDPQKSDAENIASAKAFIKKAKDFVEKQTPEFSFKPRVRFDPKFIPDPSFFKKFLADVLPDSTKTYEQVKNEFERNIKRLADNNPIVIDTQARLKPLSRARILELGGSVKINPEFEPTIEDGKLVSSIERATRFLNDKFIDISRSFQESIFQAVGDGIGKGLATGNFTDVFKGVFNAVGQALQSLGQALIGTAIGLKAIKAAFKTLNPAVALGAGVALLALGALIKNSIGNISGGRAAGGPVAAGAAYLVGEKGPEIFRPNVAGRIIANSNVSTGKGIGDTGGMQVMVAGEFVQRGNDLVAVIKMVEKSQRRLT